MGLVQANPNPTITIVNRDWQNEIRNGRCFLGGVGLAASVGNFSEGQILNPVGSTITVLIRYVLVSVNVGVGLQIRTFNTALATDQGGVINLARGSATTPQALIRAAQPVALDGTAVGSVFLNTSSPLPVFPDWVAQLAAGQGLLFAIDTTNTPVKMLFGWNEF